MKRAYLFLLIVFASLFVGLEADNAMSVYPSAGVFMRDPEPYSLSQSGGAGNDGDAVLHFTRVFSDQDISILNSFTNTTHHAESLDLNPYQVSGWHLYQAELDVNSYIAAPEYEVVGAVYETFYFQISEQLGAFYPQLAQGFYNQPHDGALMDYSIYYSTSLYDPDIRGNASFVIRSDYATGSSNVTNAQNVTASNSAFTWATIDCTNETLTANTIYWAIIDGSNLTKAGQPTAYYPTIYWGAEDDAGSFNSYLRGESAWDLRPYEAQLNYTYLPWNTTSGTVLTYSSAEQLAMTGNSSNLSGKHFVFTSANTNITELNLATNQSVYVDYNITLQYKKSVAASTQWNIDESGSIVEWNSTFDVSFPSVTGISEKKANVTKAESWTILGVYESSAPTTNHSHYLIDGEVVYCWNLDDGTWRLSAQSRNQIDQVQLYDVSDDTLITEIVEIGASVDINMTLNEEDSDPISTGYTNLSILSESIPIWEPANKSVADGTSSYQWDIDTTTSENGLYTIEVYWANGTDAGYRTYGVVVYFPTSLSVQESQIDAFTENTFEIRVDFADMHTPQPLDGDYASVLYSFNGASNVTMVDHSNGTWTASISTSGELPGDYVVDVYAIGFALANQTTTIDVTLIHETDTLSISWSDGSSISYVQATNLSVTYQRVGGQPVVDAWVNVTIGVNTWNLTYQDGTYKLVFNGTDSPPGFDTHNLFISAWKAGYQAQNSSAETLTISEEATTLVVTWTDGNSISYVESTTLVANYTMSNQSAVLGATVTATIGGQNYSLDWDTGTRTYRRTINGMDESPGLGVFSVTIHAELYGYTNQDSGPDTLTISNEVTTLQVSWISESTITYIETTTLVVDYRMSDLSHISDAWVNFTISGTTMNLTWHPGTGTYRYVFDGSDPWPGFGNHSLSIMADKHGFVYQTNSTERLIINVEPTIFNLDWSAGTTITYVGQTMLSVTYQMSDSTPISTATVNVTFGTTTWNLTYNSSSGKYEIIFYGWSALPGIGVHDLTILADLYGFEAQSNNNQTLTIDEEPTTLNLSWSNTNHITYLQSTTLSANYSMSNGTSVRLATVIATVAGTPFEMIWNEGSKMYEYTFDGDSSPPGLGEHDLVVTAERTGYASKTSPTTTLNLQEEPTEIQVGWLLSNSTTYVGSLTFIVNYNSLGSGAVANANVTAIIGTDSWQMIWTPGTQDYRFTFLGSMDPPGLGYHSIRVEASQYGYQSNSNDTARMTIAVEPTTLAVDWWNNDYDLEYFDHSYLLVNYSMSNGSAITGAWVNVTIDGNTWRAVWNETEGLFTLRFNGSDAPPGFGTHTLTVLADLHGYEEQTDSTAALILPEIPTMLELTWISSNTITYIESTILSANYSMYNGTEIEGATLNVTIDSTPLTLIWNEGARQYQFTFSGVDDPPGLGIHSLTVLADKVGFDPQSVLDTLTMTIDPTSLVIDWSDADMNITYLGNTTLSVQYLSSELSPVEGAQLNATIGTDVWELIWNNDTSAYEVTFFGYDSRLGLGSYNITIKASLFGYQSQTSTGHELLVSLEETSITYSWETESTISYVDSTILNIHYIALTNQSPIANGIVNVSIGVDYWTAMWNESSGTYQVRFYGMDDPPGLGVHLLIVEASKPNYEYQLDYSETLTIVTEGTSLEVWWEDDIDSITYVGQATVWINYTMSNGTMIPGAIVDITIGSFNTYDIDYDSGTGLYYWTVYGSDDPPGLGNHGLSIRAEKLGYTQSVNDTLSLTVSGELGAISTEWIGSDTITYVGSTIISVNYTMSNGTAISGAIVNVTVDSVVYLLAWNDTSQTYYREFIGSDPHPGFGYFNLFIQAWRDGFDYQSDSTKYLTINEEPTTLIVSWSEPNLNDTTYYNSTILQARYVMSNGTDITTAEVNVTIGDDTWLMSWNETSGFYEKVFHGSDSPPGLDTHYVTVKAQLYGYVAQVDENQMLTLREDPTTLSYTWSLGNIISYVDHTILLVNYRMSNGTDILDATVNVEINGHNWTLGWNSTALAYTLRIDGSNEFLGLDTFSVGIYTMKSTFESGTATDSVTINEENTTIAPSWTSNSFDWTETLVLSFEYASSNGSLIGSATQLDVIVDGLIYTLKGDNGTYFILLNNTFDLGLHTVEANISKYGYTFAFVDSIAFEITEAPTTLVLDWNLTTTDYLGQFDLEAMYVCLTTTAPVPMGSASVNISIDGGTPVPLTQSGSYWIANLTGISLDLGTHNVVVTANAYGYDFAQAIDQLIVEEVNTDSLVVNWQPANLTIEYFEYLNLSVDFTYYGGDVPEPASVNVTINGQTFDLLYDSGLWTVSIYGPEIGMGIHSADVFASAYGYTARNSTTSGINVTQAANFFAGLWEPLDLQPAFVEQINLTVIYTQDFEPILDATVLLIINGSDIRELTYDPLDEAWHLHIDASSLGLGVWNMTITANKTGYADGIQIDFLTVVPDTLSVTPSWLSESTDYVTPIDLQIQVRSSNLQNVDDASVEITISGMTSLATPLGGGLYQITLGPYLTLQIHTVNVTVFGDWFYTETSLLDLEVSEAESNLTIIWSATSIYFTQSATAEIYYQLQNGSYIPATCEIQINGTSAPKNWILDHWEFNLGGETWGVGAHECNISLFAYGFAAKESITLITIDENPTDITVIDAPASVFINESFTVRINYHDTIESVLIDGAIPSIDWAGGSSTTDYGNGTYDIHLTTLGLPNATYSLNVTLYKIGYETSLRSVSIQIAARFLSAIYISDIVQYENETITLSVQVFDSITAIIIEDAEVTASLQSTEYVLLFNTAFDTYLVDIFLDMSVNPGNYSVLILLEVEGYESLELEIDLTVLPKLEYSIDLQASTEVDPGDNFAVTIIVNQDGAPASDVEVKVYLLVELVGGGESTLIETATTSATGTAQVIFTIPNDAIDLWMTAEFEGSISAWPAESDDYHIEVTSAGSNILALLLSNPITLIAIGGTGIGAVAVLLRKKRNPPVGVSKSVPPNPDPPSLPVTDSQKIRRLLSKHPEGLTRKQISEMLSLSSSKVGQLVRDLLSDEKYYEWREGRSRLIRFRDGF